MADKLSPAQRSYCMSRIRGFNTGIEAAMRDALDKRGIPYQTHIMSLPGRPDFLFARARLVVFVDGDFWHGYRFPIWRKRLPKGYWRDKIERNRKRDRLNHQKLRRRGWRVIRFWGHDINDNLATCVDKIILALRRSRVKA
jgi:DNA mismatch endonuclease, patch repair protein